VDRLFLDANVLFSAAYRPNAGLYKFWNLKSVVLCSSHHAVGEARINLSGEVQRQRLTELISNLQLFDASSSALPQGIFLPDKDVPILLAAIKARATHLITGDVRHFGPYFGKKIQGVLVLLPSTYLHKRPAT